MGAAASSGGETQGGGQEARGGYPSSIGPFPSLLADWDDEAKLPQSLKDLYQATVAAAQDRIDWYDRKGRRFATSAQWLRLIVIILAGVGALAPLLGQFLGPFFNDTNGKGFVTQLFNTQLGYIALASAAILVALDNFFGFTSGWMRFRLTQADLVRRLSRFRYEWAVRLATVGTGPLGIDRKRELITLHRDFVDGFEAVVESETRIWATALQVNVAAFERQHRLATATETPGSLEVTVDNWTALKPGTVSLTLDSEPLALNSDGTAVRSSLAPGIYTLRLAAKAAADGEAIDRAEKSVRIAANATTKATI